MKSTRLISQLLPAVLALTLASGCGTTSSKDSVHQRPLTGGQVLPHHAALVLNPEFADYKHKFTYNLGGSENYPIGSALQDYARNVSEKSFQQVDVVPSEDKGAALTSTDIILIPRVVKSNNSVPGFSFGGGEFNITLVAEWTVKNRATQDTVWLKTITANASEKVGNGITAAKHKRILFQKLFDDLSLKTYNAFQEAPELRVHH